MCVSGWDQFLAPNCCVSPVGDFSCSWGSEMLETSLGVPLSYVDPRGAHKDPPRGPLLFSNLEPVAGVRAEEAGGLPVPCVAPS